MALPKQVEKQLREVEELEQQLRAKPEDGQPVAQEADPAPPETPVASSVEAPPSQPQTDSEEKWEARYRSLKGHFEAEVPRLQAQVKELNKQLTTAMQQLEQQRTPQTPEKKERLVTEKDEEAFGSDLIDVQRRVSHEVIREYVTPLQQELAKRDAKISQLEQMLGKTGGDVATMSFEQRLNRAVPDFDSINRDAKWIAWLDDLDPLTRHPRRAYAEDRYNNGDVEEVARLVSLFKESVGGKSVPNNRQAELQRQIAPTKAGAQSTSDGNRFYTETEAARLYERVRVLYSQGKNADADALDNELSKAYVEGRVRG